MPRHDGAALWRAAVTAGNLSSRFLSGADATVSLGDLACGSILRGRGGELGGRSVLVATTDQLTAALALLELDGVARRLILYPPDLSAEHVQFVIQSASVDAIVTDRTEPEIEATAIESVILCSSKVEPAGCVRSPRFDTEWILLTSGTTGRPKMVVHTLSSLVGAIKPATEGPVVWSTFYDIRRYGGLQILLRAVLTDASLVLSSAAESTADFLIRAGTRGATHISGTPSHWRRALMGTAASRITPRYLRMSGEIADQAILDQLQSCYPQAVVAHAFASTEAGVAFEVKDGRAGIPASMMRQPGDVEMKVEDGSLQIRSPRIAARYLGEDKPIAGPDGFVDTGDMLDLRDGRYYFIGRKDGVINVGGMKVHPEEVEAVINRHPQVRMSLVRTRKNPITGALVVAEVVLNAEPESPVNLQSEIFELCRQTLPRHKVPAAIRFVPALGLAATGKLVRSHA
jgi:acyl-coenzyme A synthetase/AMP-(fatty) acid ligase